MRRFILPALVLLIALQAFGHAGEVHTYMGTVAAKNADGSFVLKKTDGSTMPVAVSGKTVYRHADGSSATSADLVVGKRVVVTVAKDGKTAATIKIAAG